MFVLPNNCVIYTHHQAPRKQFLSLPYRPEEALAATAMQIKAPIYCLKEGLDLAHQAQFK